MLPRAVMHAVTFAAKRAHWSSVAFGREVVKSIRDMTPARFDILFVIRVSPWIDGPRQTDVPQDAIWKRLGLSRATMSEMLARLEELGWVRRLRHEDDRRRKVVYLTKLGLRRIDDALRIVLRQRTHLRHFEAWARAFKEDQHPLVTIEALRRDVTSIAEGFGDRATHFYDFGYREHDDFDWNIHLRPPPEPTFAERLVAFKAARALAAGGAASARAG